MVSAAVQDEVGGLTGAAASPARAEQFEAILALTHDMLEQADGGEWETVAAMEKERDELIRAFFSAAPMAEEAGWIADGLREILDSDRRVMKLGQQGMQTLVGHMRTFSVGRKAQQAYSENLT